MPRSAVRFGIGLTVVGVAGAVIVGYRAHLRRDEAMAVAVQDLKEAVDNLKNAPAPSPGLPREFIQRLREVAAGPIPQPAAPAEPAPPAATTVAARATPDREADKVQRALMAEKVTRHFQSETRDAVWAETAGQDLHRAIDPLQTANNQVTLVDCRSTLCKIEGEFENTRTFSEAMTKVFVGGNPGVAHGGVIAPVVHVAPDGQVHAEVYMARAGTSLPFVN